MKKIFLLLFFILQLPLFALKPASFSPDSPEAALRKSALRSLELAKDYLSKKNYEAALSQAQLGASYDENISDLYFIMAQAKEFTGCIKADVLPLVAKALELDSWADYNRDNARLMYADLLCDTGRFSETIGILDQKPSIFSADAEFVRAKAYYRLGGDDNLLKARVKIDGARRIYPADTRFPLLFFKYEDPEDSSADVKRIASFFISQVREYVEVSPDKDAELEIYASLFAEGKEKVNLLKSFKARGLSHPLYARSALEAGLISGTEAFDYLSVFASTSINWKYVTDLVCLLFKREEKTAAEEYFASYAGTVEYDITRDGITDVFIKYSRGRVQEIFSDLNQDGRIDWTLICDYGVPVSCTGNGSCVTWEEYPYVKTVTGPYSADGRDVKFTLPAETLSWSPVRMDILPLFKEKLSCDFYFPTLTFIPLPDSFELLAASSDFEIPSSERKGAVINFMILDSEIKEAVYKADGKTYAFARFEGNVPVMRICDADGDGIFETTEVYGLDDDNRMNVHSLDDVRSVTTNMFGVPKDNAYFYLKSVHIDTDRDTVPDFSEEYFENGGKTTFYDTDADGKWNVRHTRYGDGREEASFLEVPSGKSVTVSSKDGKPSLITAGDEKFAVSKDSVYDFYWIGNSFEYSKEFYAECARRALLELSKTHTQGYSIIVEHEGERFLAVRCGSLCFGKFIPQADYGKENDD